MNVVVLVLAVEEPTPTDYEHSILRNRWHEQLLHDPYYNHNLAPRRDDWVEKAMR